MSDKRTGPTVNVTQTCYGCVYERSEFYAIQGDSGRRVFCHHPKIAGRQVGDTAWATPDWCPERVDPFAAAEHRGAVEALTRARDAVCEACAEGLPFVEGASLHTDRRGGVESCRAHEVRRLLDEYRQDAPGAGKEQSK